MDNPVITKRESFPFVEICLPNEQVAKDIVN
jgi:hypothetical protein